MPDLIASALFLHQLSLVFYTKLMSSPTLIVSTGVLCRPSWLHLGITCRKIALALVGLRILAQTSSDDSFLPQQTRRARKYWASAPFPVPCPAKHGYRSSRRPARPCRQHPSQMS